MGTNIEQELSTLINMIFDVEKKIILLHKLLTTKKNHAQSKGEDKYSYAPENYPTPQP